MSFNVKDIYPVVGTLTFDPNQQSITTPSKPSGLQGPTEGMVWYDSVNHNLYSFVNGQSVSSYGLVNVNQTEVENTNATSATALMTYAFPVGALNVLNRVVDVFAAGEYTTDSGTARTITLAVTLGDGTNTRTLLTWTTAATTASQTSMPWNFDGALVISATGTAGTAFGHGTANVTLGASAAGALTSYNDTNTVPSSALDLTKVITLSVTQLFSGSNAGNTFEQDLIQITVG